VVRSGKIAGDWVGRGKRKKRMRLVFNWGPWKGARREAFEGLTGGVRRNTIPSGWIYWIDGRVGLE
jgi:hypothetical protein